MNDIRKINDIQTMYKNIEAERARNGWTIEQFADKIGICEKSYRNWRDSGKEIKSSVLINIVNAFNCSSDYLLGLSEVRSRKYPTTPERTR